MKKIKLLATDIINKEFKVDYQGYDPNDVDMFLNMIATDYWIFEYITNDFNKEIKYLRQQLNEFARWMMCYALNLMKQKYKSGA